MKYLAFLLIAAISPLTAQQAKSGPTSHYPVVDLKGTVKQVHIEHGAGMPWLEIETAKGPVKLILGSMRYLMQNSFSPKAGDAVTAKAFQEQTQSVALTVELKNDGKPLKLRDENGMPLWRGGAMRGGSAGCGHPNCGQSRQQAPKN